MRAAGACPDGASSQPWIQHANAHAHTRTDGDVSLTSSRRSPLPDGRNAAAAAAAAAAPAGAAASASTSARGGGAAAAAAAAAQELLGPTRPRPRKLWRRAYAKLLVVGDSGLGKTTLIKALLSTSGERLQVRRARCCLARARGGGGMAAGA